MPPKPFSLLRVRTAGRCLGVLRILLLLTGFAPIQVGATNSVILTSTMPPGGEGAASVALGVALPGGLSSMEVNPALLAWEGNRTSSTIQYSWSHSDLVPSLQALNSDLNLSEDVRSVGLRFPIKNGTDLAIGYSWHHLELGTTQYSAFPGDPQILKSGESVHHAVVSARLAGMASIGLGWKWMDSRLAPDVRIDDSGKTMRGTATSSDWDLGLLIAPRWKIPRTPVRIGPSLGMSWVGLVGDSIDYGDPRAKDPTAQLRRWGAAFTISSPDLVAVELFLDDEADVSDRYASAATRYQGWSLDVLGILRWASADLMDPDGWRSETQESYQIILDLKQIYRLKGRILSGDWTSLSEETPAGYPLPKWKILGTTISPNVRVSVTHSKIRGWSYYGAQSVRDGQKRIGWAISL